MLQSVENHLPSPPALSQELIDKITSETVQYAKTHGLVMNQKISENNYQLVHVPHVLIPTIYPRETFLHLKAIAPLFSLVVDKMSRDSKYLLEKLEPVLHVDEFTAKIASIYKKVYVDESNPQTQTLAMGIHRSDYMLHGEFQALQVELNTISSAFGAMSQLTQGMHHYIVNRFQLESKYGEAKLEENRSLDEIVGLMHLAHTSFLSQLSFKSQNQENEQNTQGKQVIVLFIIQPQERNFADQKHLEFTLFERHSIPALRVSLDDILKHGKLDKNYNLIYTTSDHVEHIVSVAYYRAGYNPSDYPTNREWEARLLVERSSAIKCPTTGYQLVGTKYIQYILTLPGVLERYLSEEECFQIRSVFTGIYSMKNEEIVKKAIENPQNYVGKPQREGGGNLLFGEHLQEVLKVMPLDVKEGYILMERISPTGQESIFCRNEICSTIQGVSELGTFCLFLGDSSSKILLNKYGGYLLRTKPKHMEDGGVASGVASMDSIALV